MNPKIQETFWALNWPALSAKGMQHMSTKWPDWQSRWFRGPEKKKDSTAGHCQGLRLSKEWVNTLSMAMSGTKLWCAGLRMETLSGPQHAAPSPSLKNLTVDKEITSFKPKICFGLKDTWETTLQCNQKPLILWHISEMCSSCGTCKCVCVCNMYWSLCVRFLFKF